MLDSHANIRGLRLPIAEDVPERDRIGRGLEVDIKWLCADVGPYSPYIEPGGGPAEFRG